jgi:hypothetical protein
MEHKHHKEHLPVWAWLSILIMAGFIAGVMLWTVLDQNDIDTMPVFAKNKPIKSQISITDWQVYENKDFGFSFSYPEKWFLYEGKNTYVCNALSVVCIEAQKDTRGQGLDEAVASGQTQTSGFTVEARKNTEKSDLDQIIAKDIKYSYDKSTIKVAQTDAIKITNNATDQLVADITNIYVIKNENLYIIHQNMLEDDQFNQILSTFQFTDSSAVSTADWTTFTDKINNFTVKYPDGWTATALSNNGINASSLDQSQSCTTVTSLAYSKENNSRFSLENGMDVQIFYCPDLNVYPDMDKLLARYSTGQKISTAGFEGILNEYGAGIGSTSIDSAIMYKKVGSGFFGISWNASDANKKGWNYKSIGSEIVKSFSSTK